MDTNKIVIEDDMPPDQRASVDNDFQGYEREDGGQFLFATLAQKDIPVHLTLISDWDHDLEHALFHSLCGKRLRITIEVLP